MIDLAISTNKYGHHDTKCKQNIRQRVKRETKEEQNMGDYFQRHKGILPLGMQDYQNLQVHREGISPQTEPLALQFPNITPT